MSDQSRLLREEGEIASRRATRWSKDWFHAGFRALDRLWLHSRSFLRLSWFRLLYPGLEIGRDVVIGSGVRFRVLNGATIRIGDCARIDSRAELHSDGTLVIGSDAYVGAGSIIVAAEHIEVGNDALIAAYVTIRDQDHRSKSGVQPYRLQGLEASPITIGNNVWIGTGTVILKGTTIGDNCVIGANSVVTRSLAANTRAVGAPASPID